ncbi:hypothetical protein PRIPAC_70181 [Pristionchus pacificus]|uniref:Uncharacterized protein n=1 Tax=Pristionchus pacificus TaxID=54126 RepID=A0A2A6BFI8_PRIPA|nr:hypothetical protein PRIPAC_70181 [Pristionchus pacificus]|eukprot:PDM64623.1 hypothetical protein PRIPAC_52879 [Pristionchus pacificus]
MRYIDRHQLNQVNSGLPEPPHPPHFSLHSIDRGSTVVGAPSLVGLPQGPPPSSFFIVRPKGGTMSCERSSQPESPFIDRPRPSSRSDCWAAYHRISNIGKYTHLTVNHSVTFKDKLPSHIGAAVFFIRHELEDRFEAMLRAISENFPIK